MDARCELLIRVLKGWADIGAIPARTKTISFCPLWIQDVLFGLYVDNPFYSGKISQALRKRFDFIASLDEKNSEIARKLYAEHLTCNHSFEAPVDIYDLFTFLKLFEEDMKLLRDEDGNWLEGTFANPSKATGSIREIAQRVKSGNWTTLDLDALADYVLDNVKE